MSRLCRKCNKQIPNWIKVNGVSKNLQNRKFCLDCSPYKKHNTKTDDPSRPSRRGCCYADWSDDEKKKAMLSVLKRGLERKRQLIEMAGGACSRCGYKYNGCERALSFHHRNPDEKKHGLSMNYLWSKKWPDILVEFSKCDMLCLTCHAEVEDEKETHKQHNYKKWLGIT